MIGELGGRPVIRKSLVVPIVKVLVAVWTIWLGTVPLVAITVTSQEPDESPKGQLMLMVVDHPAPSGSVELLKDTESPLGVEFPCILTGPRKSLRGMIVTIELAPVPYTSGRSIVMSKSGDGTVKLAPALITPLAVVTVMLTAPGARPGGTAAVMLV